jgi:hypothetical protein
MQPLHHLTIRGYIAVVLALLDGGFMIADSLERMITGSYFTIGGELGPWSILFRDLGLDPLAMAPLFLVLGIAYCICAFALLLKRGWGYYGVLILAIGTLWYLVFGTLASILQIILLAGARKRMQA